MPRIQLADKNLPAFLDMIAVSELGSVVLAESDDGYDVIVGSLPGHVVTFESYADHPRKLVEVQPGLVSSAAGRYQILAKYFTAYKLQLGLPDFGPVSQDMIAIQMIKECGAMALISAGRFARAVTKCNSRWASLPGAGYLQPEKKLPELQAAYCLAGGEVTA